MDVIYELRTEKLSAVFCNNAKGGIKNHHSLKFCKLRLLQQWLCLKHTFFQNMSLSFKKGQFLLVHAAGRTEKGGYSGAHAASEIHREKG